MIYRTMSVAVKSGAAGIPAMVALVLATHAFGQQPLTSPRQAAPVDTTQNSEQQLEVSFSPWARYCTRGLSAGQSSEIRAREVCFTAADGHLASGQKLVIALLIEPEDGDTTLLRVTLPLGVALIPGARIVIDENEAMTAPYVACLAKNGCMADYKADRDLVEKLKAGRVLAVQAFDKGKPISFTLPLTGFAKAHDGPAGDPTSLNGMAEGVPSDVSRRSYQ